jgi:hypothetical protein
LAQSIAEPPPTAIRPSQLLAWNIAAAARTAASVGLDGVWSNTVTGHAGQGVQSLLQDRLLP